MIIRLPKIKLLLVIIFILALPSLTHERAVGPTVALWFLEEYGTDSSAFRGPICIACISEAVYQISWEHGISPGLVQAIIQVESQGNTRATSRKGALGLMQLMPVVLEAYKVRDPFDPVANVQAGVKHLNYLLIEFSGNLSLALAAYNAGPGTVRKYRGVPPYPETRSFLRKVLRKYQSEVNEPAMLVQTLRAKKMVSIGKTPGEIYFRENFGNLTAVLQN